VARVSEGRKAKIAGKSKARHPDINDCRVSRFLREGGAERPSSSFRKKFLFARRKTETSFTPVLELFQVGEKKIK
jgi:hypothetical protein